MIRQDVGDDLYLVIRTPGQNYRVERKVVWGAKDTETEWGDRGYLVLVDPGQEYDPKPEGALVFRHGEDLAKFAGAFSERDIADSVCNHLNGY